MDGTESTPGIVIKTVHDLVKVLSDASSVFIEPAKVRRMAIASAMATEVLTEAEIHREERLAEARFRMEVVELRRQRNLEDIASIVAHEKGVNLAIEDKDWVMAFIESCKDTSEPVLQTIWARLLTGEMESAGSCSKRTLQMVKALSKDEALLINDTCSRVCIVEESNGRRLTFVNVLVNRLEYDPAADSNRNILLHEDDAEGRHARNERLMACGFLSSDDYKFYFGGEGRLDPEHFQLGSTSAKSIRLGARTLVANAKQPGLLFTFKKMRGPVPHTKTPAASIEFDVWRLSAEGEELYRSLQVEPDYALLRTLRDALNEGGFAVSEAAN